MNESYAAHWTGTFERGKETKDQTLNFQADSLQEVAECVASFIEVFAQRGWTLKGKGHLRTLRVVSRG